MVLKDFECPNGHAFEQAVTIDETEFDCAECGEVAERIFVPTVRRRLSSPVVWYRCADGKFSFPGDINAPPPADMVEKIECWTIQDYDRQMAKVNKHYEGIERFRSEQFDSFHSAFHEIHRSNLRTVLANCNDNAARDLIRRALAEKNTTYERPHLNRLYSEAMEFDASNRDPEHRRGERGRK